MLDFKIGDKEFQLKNDWQDITMKDWIAFQRLHRNKDLYMDLVYSVKVFDILTNATEDELMDLEIDIMNNLTANISFLGNPIPVRNSKKVLVGDKYYIFLGDLNRITMGEHISIKTFQQTIKDDFDLMMLMMAVLIRPVVTDENGVEKIERFDGATVKSRSEELLKAHLIDVNHLLAFFFNGSQKSGTSVIKNSLKEEDNLPHLRLK